MRVMLIAAMMAYIFVLGYYCAGRMGRCLVQGRVSCAKRREGPCFLLRKRPRDAAVARRIRRFQRDQRRMVELLYNAEVSELSDPGDCY